MKSYRILSALLAAWIAMLSLASCSSGGTEEQTETTAPVATETAVATETEIPAPPITEYNGYEFRISCCDYAHFIDQDESTGDRLSDAIYARNLMVEDLYKITITAEQIGGYQDVINAVKNNVQAGDDFTDLVYTPITPMLQAAYPQPELFINMRSLEKLDLSAAWWDPALTDEITIRDYCPVISGDAIITDELGLCTIMFNATMFQKIYPGESLYELAVAGDWTFDRLQAYAEGAVIDVNGDGKYDTEDQMGFYFNGADISSFVFAFGYNSLIPTDSGIPEINTEESLYDYYLKALTLVNNNSVSLKQEAIPGSYVEAFKCFTEDKTLFMSCNLTNIDSHCREMESDYGVMPYPKYDENQEDYRTVVTGWAAALAIPGTASDPERTGDILTAMAYYGKDLQAVMNDDILTAKIAREEAFADAIEIMMDSKYYSMDWMLSITGIPGILNKRAGDASDAFYSQIAANMTKAENAILTYYGE